VHQGFETIKEFTKFKETCFFCHSRLTSRLTSFTKSIPILNAPLVNERYSFKLTRVTAEYSLEAQGVVDIKSNALVFLVTDSDTPGVDQKLAFEAFVDLHPYVELYCPNIKCKYKYHICSEVLHTKYLGKKIDSWMITGPNLYYEGFIDRDLVIHNNFTHENTAIYSRHHENADPITTPMLDWEAMGKDKLLTRIRTLVTFS